MTSTHRRRTPLLALYLLSVALLMATLCYFYGNHPLHIALQQATATTAGGLSFSYKVIHTEMSVDWSGSGDFDPRGKCPDDFFGAGFQLICKKLADGTCVKFLYHKDKIPGNAYRSRRMFFLVGYL